MMLSEVCSKYKAVIHVNNISEGTSKYPTLVYLFEFNTSVSFLSFHSLFQMRSEFDKIQFTLRHVTKEIPIYFQIE